MSTEPDYLDDGVGVFESVMFDVAVDATSSRRPASMRLTYSGGSFEFHTVAAARALAATLLAAADWAEQAQR